MNKNELWKLYFEREKQVEKARNKRAIITIAVFASIFFLYVYFTERPTGTELIALIAISGLVAVCYVAINAMIFGQLAIMGENERKMLEDIKKRIDEAEH